MPLFESKVQWSSYWVRTRTRSNCRPMTMWRRRGFFFFLFFFPIYMFITDRSFARVHSVMHTLILFANNSFRSVCHAPVLMLYCCCHRCAGSRMPYMRGVLPVALYSSISNKEIYANIGCLPSNFIFAFLYRSIILSPLS